MTRQHPMYYLVEPAQWASTWALKLNRITWFISFQSYFLSDHRLTLTALSVRVVLLLVLFFSKL